MSKLKIESKLAYEESIKRLLDALNQTQEEKVKEISNQLLDKPLFDLVNASKPQDIEAFVKVAGVSQETIDSLRASLKGEDIGVAMLSTNKIDTFDF